MPRLLILLTLPPAVRDYYAARLKQRFPELEIDVADHFSKATPLAPNADILLTFGPMMKDEVVANAPKLKWVQALGTGIDGIIDQPSLGKHVTVTNIRGIHGAPVSEAAIMGMLALSRDLPRSVRSQDQNSWTRWPPKLLDNKTVGIYGIGLIAEALAPRCKAFGMTVIGYSLDHARRARHRPHASAQRPDRHRRKSSTISSCSSPIPRRRGTRSTRRCSPP